MEVVTFTISRVILYVICFFAGIGLLTDIIVIAVLLIIKNGGDLYIRYNKEDDGGECN